MEDDSIIGISNSTVCVHNTYIVKHFLWDPKVPNLETLHIPPSPDSLE